MNAQRPAREPDGGRRPGWIFGYGSLLWRPAFDPVERRPAYVRGWARRFWQASTDHRGVPDAPGRVVTLVPEPRARCFGLAYRLAPEQADAVLAALDARESGGYARRDIELRFASGESRVERGITYVAAPGNPNYLGPAPLEQIAAQVRRSTGPSGSNLACVLRLADVIRSLDGDDDHVFALEELLLAGGG